MKILLIGKNGQVGYELERSLQYCGKLIAVDRAQMNLENLTQIRSVIRDVRPDLIINAAAYTSVDEAENKRQLAMRINAEAPGIMAEEAKKLGAALIHYSTDYVFEGTKELPYTEEDTPCPTNVYGHTKLLGEQAIQESDIPYLIFRTSWVYGMRGRNFLLSILRLAEERDELRIVNDQHGSPTWSRTIADTTANIVTQLSGQLKSESSNGWSIARDAFSEKAGIYNLASHGQTTWFGFARAILELAPLQRNPILTPITTKDYPLPAVRPVYSVLDCKKIKSTFCETIEWRTALALSLKK